MTTPSQTPLCDRHAAEPAMRTKCVICALEQRHDAIRLLEAELTKRYDAIKRLAPFLVDEYYPFAAPEFRAAVEAALAVLEPEDRP